MPGVQQGAEGLGVAERVVEGVADGGVGVVEGVERLGGVDHPGAPAGSFSSRNASPWWKRIGGVDRSTSRTNPGRRHQMAFSLSFRRGGRRPILEVEAILPRRGRRGGVGDGVLVAAQRVGGGDEAAEVELAARGRWRRSKSVALVGVGARSATSRCHSGVRSTVVTPGMPTAWIVPPGAAMRAPGRSTRREPTQSTTGSAAAAELAVVVAHRAGRLRTARPARWARRRGRRRARRRGPAGGGAWRWR